MIGFWCGILLAAVTIVAVIAILAEIFDYFDDFPTIVKGIAAFLMAAALIAVVISLFGISWGLIAWSMGL